MRVSGLLGVRIFTGVKFDGVGDPLRKNGLFVVKTAIHDKEGFNARCNTLHANVLIDAAGTAAPVVKHFKIPQTKEKLSNSLGLVAHFERAQGESRTAEFNMSRQFAQKAFNALKAKGIELENIVHFKRQTHYVVMTPTADSLIAQGCFKAKKDSYAELLDRSNVDQKKLREYARTTAMHFGFPIDCKFIDWDDQQDDKQAAQVFDFSERTETEKAMHVVQSGESQLLVFVVGDALMEPFWPEGYASFCVGTQPSSLFAPMFDQVSLPRCILPYKYR